MAIIQRLYLDTNMFIELAEVEGERQRLLSKIAILQMANGKPFVCTSELTLAELLVRPYRQQNEKLIELYNGWIMHDSHWLDVMSVSRDVLWNAALVRRHYSKVKLPDAIHLATAIGFKCSHFLTADKKIPNEIQIPNDRWGFDRPSSILKVIEPTPDTLQSILSDRA